MYRQLTIAMPAGQRNTVASRDGPLPPAPFPVIPFPVTMTGMLPPGDAMKPSEAGQRGRRVTVGKALRTVGLRSTHLQLASLGSVGLCIGLWIRAKTVDQDERGNAERRALFVGLWPPMLWLIGDSLQDSD
jgi:hypothetical protein